jgi:hypothetical protein
VRVINLGIVRVDNNSCVMTSYSKEVMTDSCGTALTVLIVLTKARAAEERIEVFILNGKIYIRRR